MNKMIEKFSDYESAGFLSEEGEFVFEITNAELKDSKNGNPMVVLDVKSEAGTSTLYHSLSPKARWSYNNLIKACLKLDTKEKIANFECDYETIHQELIGKTFLGKVECETYEKEIKIPLDDGTFETGTETKESYKVKSYKIA
jgi:hypothetical protein